MNTIFAHYAKIYSLPFIEMMYVSDRIMSEVFHSMKLAHILNNQINNLCSP